MYKISIIIPTYNVEKYLRDLLESIINQTMNFREIQVIMVDDLSKDNTRDIIDEYTAKYSNFIGIKLNKNNKIAGTARNEGMKVAEGKYLMFADSDDFYPKDACEKLYNAIEQKKADFITANYINADFDGTVWEKPIFDKEKYKDFKLSITDYNKSFYILNSSACNKIFRKTFVEEHQIKFLEGVPAEDAYFTTSCFIQSKKVYYLSDVIYCYRQRNEGNKKSKSVSFNCSRDYFSRINNAYQKIYNNFKENGHLGFYRYTYAKNMSYMLYKFIDSSMLTDEQRIDVLKEMRWFYNLSDILKVPAAQKCQRMIIEKIQKEDYEGAINYCKIIADIRTQLPKDVKENMSRPDSEMYKEISKYDEEFKEKENMFKNIYAKMCNNKIFDVYNIEPVPEDYFLVDDNIFCIADGVTRDTIEGKAVPYPKTKEEVVEWKKMYPNPSGAYESAKICGDNFVKK